MESLILRADVRGLDVLPGRQLVENATELLASARMVQIATRLVVAVRGGSCCWILHHCSVSSEARALTRIPGQVVLVARVGVTPLQAVAEAIAHVDKSKLQGLVLNHAPFMKGAGYAEYGTYGGGDNEH